MKPDIKQQLVPKLRFPEFREAIGWQQSELGNESSILKGKGISKSDIHPNGIQPCIRYGELYTHYNEVIDSIISRTNISADELLLSRANDVITPASGETKIDIATASCVLLDGIALGSDLNVIRSAFNGSFLSYYLNSPKRYEIAKVAQGDAVVHLYPNQLEKIEIAFPSPTEQQKIADCLSTLDERIGAESRKLDALKTHKKGLMQQLFPREGETLSPLRFPEFQNAPEWNKMKLGDISNLVRGPFGGSLKKEIFVKSGYAVYEQFHAIYEDFSFFRYYIQETKYMELKRFSVKPNDIIMSCSGTMGKFAIIPPDAKNGVINQALLKVTVKKDILPKFMKELLELSYNQEQLLSQSAGGAIKNVVSVAQIKELVLFVPSLNEQRKITEFISNFDGLITAQTDKLETLKTHKKALMQQLFPEGGVL